MNLLTVKLIRDVRNQWTQFFSVFLMAFLSVLVFMGLQGAWGGLAKSLENFVDTSQLADTWIYGTTVTAEDESYFKSLANVQKVQRSTRLTSTHIDGTTKHSVSLDVYQKQNISEPHVVKGAALRAQKRSAIWVNKEYARANTLQVGDSMQVQIGTKTVRLKIAGLVQSAERIYFTGTGEYIAPNYKNYGYGYISEATVKEDYHLSLPPNVIQLRAPQQPKKIRQKSEEQLGERYVAYYNQETLPDVSDALGRVGQIRNLSYMFSFLFILLAILAMYTTIKRLIDAQLKEIAVLKALGFSNGQMGRHYASYGFLTGGGGALLGALAAPGLSLFVLETQKEMFSLPSWSLAYNWQAVLIVVFVCVICTVAAYFASGKVRRGLPAFYLRGSQAKAIHHLWIERSATIWGQFSFATKWALRDARANWVRVLMGIVGVSGGMMLMTAGFGMPDSIYHLVEKTYQQDFTYSYRLNSQDVPALKTKIAGQGVQVVPARFQPDDGFNRNLMIIEPGRYIKGKTTTDKQMKADGLYLTKGFAKRAKLAIGETVTVHSSASEKPIRLKVQGILKMETAQGAYVYAKKWQEAGGRTQFTTLLVGNQETQKTLEKLPTVTEVIAKADQEANANEFVTSLMSIFLMIIGFAILLVVVVLYNLGSLSFVERTRDYATLKVLGFTKKELGRITRVENICLTLVGWVLGIPLGLLFLDRYVQTFSTIHFEYTSHLSLLSFCGASLVCWICSLTTSFFIGRRIQKVDMVSALKGVE